MRIPLNSIAVGGVALTALCGIVPARGVPGRPQRHRRRSTIRSNFPQSAALRLVRAMSITDEATRQTVVDTAAAPNPPPPASRPREGPPPPMGVSTETSGRERMALHGPQGEVNGVLLESGVILRFPPDQSTELALVIQPREPPVAEGITVTNALGTVVVLSMYGAISNVS